jgi:glycosyltransferase involved in cell wall biosynthesis
MKQKSETKSRILLLIKVPPPVTGATLMNKQVLDSELLIKNFNIRSIQISYVNNIKELGKYNIRKFIRFCRIFIVLNYECIFHRPHFVYFQISHLGIPFYRDLIFVLFLKLFKIKIVYHLHGKGIKEKVENKLSKTLYRFAFRRSEIICLSLLLVNDIEDVFKGNVHIISNGIPDNAGVNILSSRLKVSHDKILFLFLSNLIISKGILDFLESLKILSDKNVNFEAIIVGAESDFTSRDLDDKLKEFKLDNKVVYLGPKYGEEKEKILLMCDVLVFPTKNDVFGNVILEAMEFGLPVIATREGAIPEIIDDEVTGFLVEKNNPSQISEKLEMFINAPSLCKTMGAAGRDKFLKKYTLDLYESNLKDIFNKILDQGQRG